MERWKGAASILRTCWRLFEKKKEMHNSEGNKSGGQWEQECGIWDLELGGGGGGRVAAEAAVVAAEGVVPVPVATLAQQQWTWWLQCRW